MKNKYIITLSALSFFINIVTFAMSPGQVAQKTSRFRKLIADYKILAKDAKGLTPEAQKLKAEANTIIKQISPYTTTSALKNELFNVTITAEVQYKQRARHNFDKIVDFFGNSEYRTTRTSDEDRKREGLRYYNITAQNLINDGRKLAKRMSSESTNTSLLFQTDKTIRDIYEIMNIFGNPNSLTSYGMIGKKDSLTNFIASTDMFLKNLEYTLKHIYDGITPQSILTFKQDKNMTVLQALDSNLRNYNTFIRDIMEARNIADAMENMNKELASIKFIMPDYKISSPKPLTDKETFKQKWQSIFVFLTGQFKNDWMDTHREFTKEKLAKDIQDLKDEKEIAEAELNKKIRTLQLQLATAQEAQEFVQKIETLYQAINKTDRPKEGQWNKAGLEEWLNQGSWWQGTKGKKADFVKGLGMLALKAIGEQVGKQAITTK